MPPDNPGIKSKLDELAEKIVDDALTTVSSVDRLDAFKLLTNYYATTTKLDNKNKSKDGDDGGETFDSYRKSVETGSGTGG